MKLPPIEKIPEAWSAIIDGRVAFGDGAERLADVRAELPADDAEAAADECSKCQTGEAHVMSSDGSKEYLVQWKGDTFYSNDNATYWQGYPGYPVLAVLMVQGRLPYDERAASCFAGVDWHRLNAAYKRNYGKALQSILDSFVEETQAHIHQAMQEAYSRLQTFDLALTRKRFITA